MDEAEEVDELESHQVDAFDRGARIMVMTDGSLRLKVPLMPPSWDCIDGAFDSFEDQLSTALGWRSRAWTRSSSGSRRLRRTPSNA